MQTRKFGKLNWNRDPRPLAILQKLKEEGKIRAVGISTPEHDQNCVIELMRSGLLDSVQVIYNIFEQDPATLEKLYSHHWRRAFWYGGK